MRDYTKEDLELARTILSDCTIYVDKTPAGLDLDSTSKLIHAHVDTAVAQARAEEREAAKGFEEAIWEIEKQERTGSSAMVNRDGEFVWVHGYKSEIGQKLWNALATYRATPTEWKG